MDSLFLPLLLFGALWGMRLREQAQRIALLGRHLARYQIEKQMEALTQGYLRALGERDPQRREQVWAVLAGTEQALAGQFSRFAAEMAGVDESASRVSRLPVHLPWATRLLPAATFDLRRALAVHARGIRRAIEQPAGASASDRAYTISAELFLMQHTCHWFCKSRTVASARMLARHKTSYDQVVGAVSPQTRADYCSLVNGR